MPAETIEQFLMQVEKHVFVMARIATRNEDDALDIVQDAMIKLVNKYANKTSSEWSPLFYRILQSKIHDWHRKQTVQNRWQVWTNKLRGIGNNENNQRADLENHSLDQDRLPDDVHSDYDFEETLEMALSQLSLRQNKRLCYALGNPIVSKRLAAS